MDLSRYQLGGCEPTNTFPSGWKVIIPEGWLRAACTLRPKTLSVGIALWYLVGKNQSRDVKLSNLVALRFNVDRKAKAAGLKDLENANLIRVQRLGKGRSPFVKVLDPPMDQS